MWLQTPNLQTKPVWDVAFTFTQEVTRNCNHPATAANIVIRSVVARSAVPSVIRLEMTVATRLHISQEAFSRTKSVAHH